MNNWPPRPAPPQQHKLTFNDPMMQQLNEAKDRLSGELAAYVREREEMVQRWATVEKAYQDRLRVFNDRIDEANARARALAALLNKAADQLVALGGNGQALRERAKQIMEG